MSEELKDPRFPAWHPRNATIEIGAGIPGEEGSEDVPEEVPEEFEEPEHREEPEPDEPEVDDTSQETEPED